MWETSRSPQGGPTLRQTSTANTRKCWPRRQSDTGIVAKIPVSRQDTGVQGLATDDVSLTEISTAQAGCLSGVGPAFQRRGLPTPVGGMGDVQHTRWKGVGRALERSIPSLARVGQFALTLERQACHRHEIGGGKGNSPSRATLLHSIAAHRLSGHPGKGLNFSFQGERLGGEFPVLDGVPITSRSSATGTVHPADRVAPNRRRSAL